MIDPAHCVTCSDEAVEAVVEAVEGLTARVSVEGFEEHVAIDLVPDAAPGDVLLCHAGIALERLESAAVHPHVAQSHKLVDDRPGPPGRIARSDASGPDSRGSGR